MATAAKKEGSVNHAAEEENANGADGVEDMDVDGEEGGGAGESVSKSDVPVPGSGVESKIPIERGAAGGKKHAKNEPGGRGESGGVVGGGGDGGGEGGDGGKSRVGESRTLDNTTEKYYHDKKASDPDIGEEGSNHEHEDEKTSSDKDQKGCFVPFFAVSDPFFQITVTTDSSISACFHSSNDQFIFQPDLLSGAQETHRDIVTDTQ